MVVMMRGLDRGEATLLHSQVNSFVQINPKNEAGQFGSDLDRL